MLSFYFHMLLFHLPVCFHNNPVGTVILWAQANTELWIMLWIYWQEDIMLHCMLHLLFVRQLFSMWVFMAMKQRKCYSCCHWCSESNDKWLFYLYHMFGNYRNKNCRFFMFLNTRLFLIFMHSFIQRRTLYANFVNTYYCRLLYCVLYFLCEWISSVDVNFWLIWFAGYTAPFRVSIIRSFMYTVYKLGY
jgi:hypothetical protein